MHAAIRARHVVAAVTVLASARKKCIGSALLGAGGAPSGTRAAAKPLQRCTRRCTLCRVSKKTYSIASARAKLAEIIDDVEAGEEVELLRRGKKVAVVVSPAKYARLAGHSNAFGMAYDAFVATHDLHGHGLGKDFTVGLRDKSAGRAVKL